MFIRDTFRTTILSVIGKGLGFLVPIVIARIFGVSVETDAFFYTYGIVLFVVSILLPVIESAIVPYVVEIIDGSDEENDLLGILSVWAVVVGSVICTFIIGFLPFFLSMATNFEERQIEQVVLYFFGLSLLIIITLLSTVYSGFLNARKRFSVVAISPVVRAGICLVFILMFSESLGFWSVIIGYTLGEILRLSLFLYAARNVGVFRFKGVFHPTAKQKKMLRNVAHQTSGLAVVNSSTIIDSTMAAWVGAGAISLLFYAERFNMILATLFTSGILVTLLSYCSETYFSKGADALRLRLNKIVKVCLIIGVIAVLVLININGSVISWFFYESNISANDKDLLKQMWDVYLIAFIPYIVARIYVRGLVILKMGKVIMLGGWLKIIIKVVFNIIFIKIFGLIGLVYATMVMTLFEAIYFYFQFNRCLNLQMEMSR
ncbi:MAG: oligosaccharide flippase family protein [Gammaproteobacteria bacterium]|nr:oligosaccharide flippase family protein [Gammaproteobacteria bacterium]